DVLSVSPVLLERYMSTARRVARLAVGDLATKPYDEEYSLPRTGGRSRNERVSDDLPFDSAGGTSIQHYFPVDADYVLRVQFNPPNESPRTPVEIRIPVKAGLHSIGVTFLRESTKPEVALPPRRIPGVAIPPPKMAGSPFPMDIRLDGAKVKRVEVP